MTLKRLMAAARGTRERLLTFLRDRKATAKVDIRLERAAEVGGVESRE
jgi:hypothetical protein